MDRDGMIVRGAYHTHKQLQKWWQCRCGSSLVLKFRDGWVTECAASPEHDADRWFITQGKAHEEVGKMMVYQDWYRKEGEGRMSFVKDRHTESGELRGRFRVRRAGRIALGEKREGGGARSLPYFLFKPYEEGVAGEAMLQQVEAAIEEFAPGIDPEKPNVLPIYFPADSLELMASSTYKLAGKEGRPRCVGDGEIIQFKLGERNLIEVSNGEVSATNVDVDGEKYKKGQVIPCPGRSQEGRWTHCEKCGLKLSIDLQIANLPYIWQLVTGDQAFYDQFFTTLGLCDDYVKRGMVQFLTQIPLLLRREEGVRARPNERGGETYLTWQEMPTLSIEIHPIWKAQMDASRSVGLQSGDTPTQIEAPKPWYERAMKSVPERPWEPEDVGMFVTAAMREYSQDNDNSDEVPPDNTIKIAKGDMSKIFSKTMEKEDVEKAIDLVSWYLFGGPLQVFSQCAAAYRWARVTTLSEGKEGTALSPHFEQELLTVLDVAAESATESSEEEPSL